MTAISLGPRLPRQLRFTACRGREKSQRIIRKERGSLVLDCHIYIVERKTKKIGKRAFLKNYKNEVQFTLLNA